MVEPCMYKLRIPDPTNILFESALEPNMIMLNKLRKDNEGTDYEGLIEGMRGKKNRISIGIPYHEELISRMEAKNEEISHEIKQLAKENDFHFISLNCSFLPDNDCRFEWARFNVELNAADSKTEQLLIKKPVAFQMFPDIVTSETKVSRELSLTPQLKLTPGVEIGVNGGLKRNEDYIVYEPQITTYGIGTPSVKWDFKNTKEKGIWGNRQLQLIIQSPKDAKITAKFVVGAEVSSKLAGWLRIRISKNKDDKAIDKTYDLS